VLLSRSMLTCHSWVMAKIKTYLEDEDEIATNYVCELLETQKVMLPPTLTHVFFSNTPAARHQNAPNPADWIPP